jgi:DNA primase
MGPRSYPVCYFEHHPIILPYRNAYGQVVALVGRSLLNDEERALAQVDKYKNTRESNAFKKGNLVFGLYENKRSILDEGCVYVVEGQFDVIKAVEKGFKNIVALGTNSMTPYQFSVISRYTDNIFLLLDNDEGGEKGRKKIVDKFGKFANIQNFYLPNPYKDIDEYFTKTGEESVSFVVRG